MTTFVIILAAIAAGLVAWLLWIFIRGPWFRNRGQGWLQEIFIGEDSAAARCVLSPAIEIQKRVCNLTRTAPDARAWTTQVLAGVADVLQFRLEFRNTGYMSVPAGEIRVADDPDRNGDFVDGSGLANINGGPDIPLGDDLMNQFFADGILMSDIPGAPAELGPRQSLFIRYRVRVTRPAGGAPGGGGPGP